MIPPKGNARPGCCLALLAVSLLAAGCTSTPFSSTSDFDRTFIGAAQTWDLDKNGVVTCDEWKRYTATSLREADINGDGALDQEEWARMAKSDRLFEMANLAYFDANSDGRATADELAAKSNPAFRLLDKNQDCQIDRTESVQVYSIDKPKEKEVDQQIPSPGGGR